MWWFQHHSSARLKLPCYVFLPWHLPLITLHLYPACFSLELWGWGWNVLSLKCSTISCQFSYMYFEELIFAVYLIWIIQWGVIILSHFSIVIIFFILVWTATTNMLIYVIYTVYLHFLHIETSNHAMICRRKQMMERVQIYCEVLKKVAQVVMLSLYQQPLQSISSTWLAFR